MDGRDRRLLQFFPLGFFDLARRFAVRGPEARPELADHLERSVITGTYCRYRQADGTIWDVEGTLGDRPTADIP